MMTAQAARPASSKRIDAQRDVRTFTVQPSSLALQARTARPPCICCRKQSCQPHQSCMRTMPPSKFRVPNKQSASAPRASSGEPSKSSSSCASSASSALSARAASNSTISASRAIDSLGATGEVAEVSCVLNYLYDAFYVFILFDVYRARVARGR